MNKEKVYINERGQEEKCYLCKEKFYYIGRDNEEPLEVYECKCKKEKRYIGINGYDG